MSRSTRDGAQWAHEHEGGSFSLRIFSGADRAELARARLYRHQWIVYLCFVGETHEPGLVCDIVEAWGLTLLDWQIALCQPSRREDPSDVARAPPPGYHPS